MVRPAESQVYEVAVTSSTARSVSCLGRQGKRPSIPPPTASRSIAVRGLVGRDIDNRYGLAVGEGPGTGRARPGCRKQVRRW